MNVKRIIVILGILWLTFSEFAFIQIHEYFVIIWLSTGLITLISFILILVEQIAWKEKLKWVGLLAVGITLLILTRQFQFETSCKWYVASNEPNLLKMVEMVKQTERHVHAYQTWQVPDTSAYKPYEAELKSLMEETGSQYVSGGLQSDGMFVVFFELWGFLDSRFSIIYCELPQGMSLPERYIPIKGNWYH